MSLENLDAIIARLRRVYSGDPILAEDHNDLVDAVKEIRNILRNIPENFKAKAVFQRIKAEWSYKYKVLWDGTQYLPTSKPEEPQVDYTITEDDMPTLALTAPGPDPKIVFRYLIAVYLWFYAPTSGYRKLNQEGWKNDQLVLSYPDRRYYWVGGEIRQGVIPIEGVKAGDRIRIYLWSDATDLQLRRIAIEVLTSAITFEEWPYVHSIYLEIGKHFPDIPAYGFNVYSANESIAVAKEGVATYNDLFPSVCLIKHTYVELDSSTPWDVQHQYAELLVARLAIQHNVELYY